MAWLPAIASIGGSILSFMGQEDTNDTNKEIQQNNSAFNAEQAMLNRQFQSSEAGRQMQFQSDMAVNQRDFGREIVGRQENFQERMANSEYQRTTADMLKAGLNPMLAYKQGGAASGSGGTASMSLPSGASGSGSQASAGNPGNMINTFAAAGNAARQWAEVENIQADTEKKREEAKFTGTQERGYQGEQDVRVDKMRKEAEKTVQDTNLSVEQRKKVMEEVNEVIARTKNLDADTAVKKVNEVLQKYDVPRMQAEAAYFKTDIGRTSPHNKYGPQNMFRFLEGLGERLINGNSARQQPEAETDARREYGR